MCQDLRASDCSCPMNRAWETVFYGDESPNYTALTIQLRKSYVYKYIEYLAQI